MRKWTLYLRMLLENQGEMKQVADWYTFYQQEVDLPEQL
jgi:hypothetical protein